MENREDTVQPQDQSSDQSTDEKFKEGIIGIATIVGSVFAIYFSLVDLYYKGHIFWAEIAIKGIIIIPFILGLIYILVNLFNIRQKSQWKRISKRFKWIGYPWLIFLVVFISFVFLAKIFPIKDYIDKDNSKHQTALNTFCYGEATDTSTPTSTNTITPTPTITLTPTPTPTSTPTITPSPTLGLESACIPEYWGVYPYNFDSYKIIDDLGCATFPRLGISGIESGIKIFKIPEGDRGVWGIYRQIESNSFDIKFRISINSFDVGAFYFGFIDPENTDIKDDMFRIQKDPDKYFSYLKFEDNLILTEISDENELIIIISVDDSANLAYDISFEGKSYKNSNNQYSSSNDNFFIGYYFGVSQTLNLELLEFEINEY